MNPDKKLATILAADIVGYTRLMNEDETGTLARLTDCEVEVIDPIVRHFKGRVFKRMGDGFLAAFSSAGNAIECGQVWQRESMERGLPFRIGIHTGVVLPRGTDLFGDGVNIAARLEPIAETGGIVISEDCYRQVAGKQQVRFDDLGAKSLKNVANPIRVYAVRSDPQHKKDERLQTILRAYTRPKIAVLPLQVQGGDDEELLGKGFSEEIINTLSRYRALRVASRQSSFSLPAEASLPMIRRELDSRYVLTGSFRRSPTKVRISVQLDDADTGEQVWAERYDREMDDLFDLQDEIAQRIASEMVPEITKAEQIEASRKPPSSLNVWELYQRGQWHLYKFTNSDIREAINLFVAATELDPDFAPAFASLAYAKVQQTQYDRECDPKLVMEEALQAAKRAIQIDDRDAFAHFVVSRIYGKSIDSRLGLAAAETAIRLNPSFAPAYFGAGECLMHHGNYELALKRFESAADLGKRESDHWVYRHHQAWILFALGRFDEAVDLEREVLLDPKASYFPLLPVICALGLKGATQEASEAIAEIRKAVPDFDLEFADRMTQTTNAEFKKKIMDGFAAAGLC